MSTFQGYANFYDTLYEEKNYSKECDFLGEVFKKYALDPVKTILDLGCGTGGHTILLAKRGYSVSGVDLSPNMLELTRKKAKKEGLSLDLSVGDARDFNLNKKFDAVISMFAVMGYQTTNEDLEKAFKSVRKHLNTGGLFTFDVWFGPGVLIDQPTDRVKIIEHDGERIIRIAKPVMDVTKQTVQVNYTVIRISDGKVLEESEESHLMRYFFPQEVSYFLEKNGFEVQSISLFMELEKEISADDWNISVIAKAK